MDSGRSEKANEVEFDCGMMRMRMKQPCHKILYPCSFRTTNDPRGHRLRPRRSSYSQPTLCTHQIYGASGCRPQQPRPKNRALPTFLLGGHAACDVSLVLDITLLQERVAAQNRVLAGHVAIKVVLHQLRDCLVSRVHQALEVLAGGGSGGPGAGSVCFASCAYYVP